MKYDQQPRLYRIASGSQVRFVMGEATTLGDLLELQLHRVEDEVKNIVDKAVKEMAIEKVRAESKCVILSVPEVVHKNINKSHNLR